MINAGYIPHKWDLCEDVVNDVIGIVDHIDGVTGGVILLTFGKQVKTHRAFLNLILRPDDDAGRKD